MAVRDWLDRDLLNLIASVNQTVQLSTGISARVVTEDDVRAKEEQMRILNAEIQSKGFVPTHLIEKIHEQNANAVALQQQGKEGFQVRKELAAAADGVEEAPGGPPPTTGATNNLTTSSVAPAVKKPISLSFSKKPLGASIGLGGASAGIGSVGAPVGTQSAGAPVGAQNSFDINYPSGSAGGGAGAAGAAAAGAVPGVSSGTVSGTVSGIISHASRASGIASHKNMQKQIAEAEALIPWDKEEALRKFCYKGVKKDLVLEALWNQFWQKFSNKGSKMDPRAQEKKTLRVFLKQLLSRELPLTETELDYILAHFGDKKGKKKKRKKEDSSDDEATKKKRKK